MHKKFICSLLILSLSIFFASPVMAMGRKVKRTEQPASLDVPQPEVELIEESLPPQSPISEELKETKSAEISAQLAPDVLTRNKQIQTALKNAGFDPGPMDGKIGPRTRKAVKDFQGANGLKTDGKVGPKTWAKLSPYLLKEKNEKGGN